ncbi:sodium:proton antiporter [Parendozoicomonas haliclonae]|uniref:Sodium:proton antiporter n=1 Tax=Parendozoicomonas haliclonae TaxID=1960125 RepID=A0A1X7AHN3_9GAMM|nr:sodium:proton antiporter [Parendozoicomonas haliclonae]SMA41798.1 hypothetical protein EHSB41UT_01328 [Parendozoicomonas haliclonae]
MRKVTVYSLLLLLGLILSQWLPLNFGDSYTSLNPVIVYLTMAALSYIMIEVGYEFDIDKNRLGQYKWDYVVAMTAATFPWLFVVLYFVFVLAPAESWGSFDTWKEMLLLGRFAAPTSAGVLFTMLAAAGLGATWLFKKARVLAIFDDLDTVLLMIPLSIMMAGLTWQMMVMIALIIVMLTVGYQKMRALAIPSSWKWMLFYAFIIATASKSILLISTAIDPSTPIHIEVLLPAFLLGCMIKTSAHGHSADQAKANTVISAVFMILVGLNMPLMNFDLVSSGDASQDWNMILTHVFFVTVISNIGKMFPLLCYRKEASVRERLALSIGMFPRGEVGAGVLIISLGYGVGGVALTIAMLSLTLNLLLTGVFIMAVKRLLNTQDQEVVELSRNPEPA